LKNIIKKKKDRQRDRDVEKGNARNYHHFKKTLEEQCDQENMNYKESLVKLFRYCFNYDPTKRFRFAEIIETGELDEILNSDKNTKNENLNTARKEIWDTVTKKCGDQGVPFGTLFDEMELNFVLPGMEKLSEERRDIIKKYTFCQIKRETTFDRGNYESQKTFISENEYISFMNLYGHILIKESKEKRKELGVDPNPFNYIYDKLWHQPWFFDATSSLETGKELLKLRNQLKAAKGNVKKDKETNNTSYTKTEANLKKLGIISDTGNDTISLNLFLVRRGDRDKDSFTVEFLIDKMKKDNDDYKKISFKDFFEMSDFLKAGFKTDTESLKLAQTNISLPQKGKYYVSENVLYPVFRNQSLLEGIANTIKKHRGSDKNKKQKSGRKDNYN